MKPKEIYIGDNVYLKLTGKNTGFALIIDSRDKGDRSTNIIWLKRKEAMKLKDLLNMVFPEEK